MFSCGQPLLGSPIQAETHPSEASLGAPEQHSSSLDRLGSVLLKSHGVTMQGKGRGEGGKWRGRRAASKKTVKEAVRRPRPSPSLLRGGRLRGRAPPRAPLSREVALTSTAPPRRLPSAARLERRFCGMDGAASYFKTGSVGVRGRPGGPRGDAGSRTSCLNTAVKRDRGGRLVRGGREFQGNSARRGLVVVNASERRDPSDSSEPRPPGAADLSSRMRSHSQEGASSRETPRGGDLSP